MSLVLIIVGSYLLASAVVLVFAMSLCRVAKRYDEDHDRLRRLERERRLAASMAPARRPVTHRRRPAGGPATPPRPAAVSQKRAKH